MADTDASASGFDADPGLNSCSSFCSSWALEVLSTIWETHNDTKSAQGRGLSGVTASRDRVGWKVPKLNNVELGDR